MTQALGSIETIGFAVAVAAADAAVKAANVRLLGAENSRGSARVTVKFVGDVGAVNAAVAAGVAAAERIGKVAACLVIPRLHVDVEERARLTDLGVVMSAAGAASVQSAPASPSIDIAASESAASESAEPAGAREAEVTPPPPPDEPPAPHQNEDGPPDTDGSPRHPTSGGRSRHKGRR